MDFARHTDTHTDTDTNTETQTHTHTQTQTHTHVGTILRSHRLIIYMLYHTFIFLHS